MHLCQERMYLGCAVYVGTGLGTVGLCLSALVRPVSHTLLGPARQTMMHLPHMVHLPQGIACHLGK